MNPPPSNPRLGKHQPTTTAHRISLSRPLEPYTYEQLIKSSRKDKFPSSCSSEHEHDEDNREGHYGSPKHQCRCSASPITVVPALSSPVAEGNLTSPWFSHASTDITFPSGSEPPLEGPQALSQNVNLEALEGSAELLGKPEGGVVAAETANEDAEPLVAFEEEGDRNKNAKAKGKAKADEQEQLYFGENSNMSSESVRSSPDLPNEGLAWGGGHEHQGLELAAENHRHRWTLRPDRQNLGNVSGSSQSSPWVESENLNGASSLGSNHDCDASALINRENPVGWNHSYHEARTRYPRNANHPSRAGDYEWGEPVPAQEAQEAQEGDANKGWGTWGGGWGGDSDSGSGSGNEWINGSSNECNQWGPDVKNGAVFEETQKQWPDHVSSRHPSLLQGTTLGPQQGEWPGAVRSRDQSDATVRPFPRPQKRLLVDNSSPTEAHKHYHRHKYTTAQRGQSSQAQQNEKLIMELREQNSNQVELLTEQRIRVAVLENDLKHMKNSREDAVNASIFMTRNLGLASTAQNNTSNRAIDESSHSYRDNEVQKLNLEIDGLRKEKKTLENFVNCFVNHFKEGLTFSGDVNDDLPSSSAKGYCKGKKPTINFAKKSSESKYGALASGVDMKRAVGERLQEADQKDQAVAALQKATAELSTHSSHTVKSSSDSEIEKRGVSGWNEASSSDITTVLNSPALNHSSSNHEVGGFPSADRMLDVGPQSLDDCFAEDSDDSQTASKPPEKEIDMENLPTLSTPKENFAPSSAEIKLRMKEMLPFDSVPAPSVLKIGFDISNAKRGGEYDYLAPQPAPQRSGISNYNRFDATVSTKNDSNISACEFWTSSEERNRVIEAHQRQVGSEGIRYPDTFRYGIQYIPQEDDENYLRTVTISNLRSNIELRDVLARVRGGAVVDAVLMDTRRLMGGTMSARIVFLEDYAAHAFVYYASANPIAFGEDDNAINAVVTLVPTPTYPLAYGIQKLMKQDRKNTRYLAVRNFPKNLSISKLQYDISCGNCRRADNLVEFYLDINNTLYLEFSSIPLAGSAFGILTNWRYYRGLQVSFELDPCTGPLEELALPLPPRPPLLPRNRLQSPSTDTSLTRMSFSSEDQSRLPVAEEDQIKNQRKPLAALSNQKVIVSSFSGTNIKSESWADEVIEEYESSNAMTRPDVSATTTQVKDPNPSHDIAGNNTSADLTKSKLTLQLHQDEHNDLPHTHSEAPPNSPVDAVLPVSYEANTEVKTAVDALMIEDINRMMQKNLSAFSKAHGLSSSRYASNYSKFENTPEPVKCNNKMESFVQDTENGGGRHQVTRGEASNDDVSSDVRVGNEEDTRIQTAPHYHSELQPSKLLAMEMSSDSSVKSALELLRENFIIRPDVQDSLNRPQSVLQESLTPRLFPTRSISTDTFYGPSQRAQYKAKSAQALPNSPLAQFNEGYDREEAHTSSLNNRNAAESPERKARAKTKLADAIASKPDLPENVLERVVTGTWYPMSGPPFTYIGQHYDPNEPKGRITRRTRLRDASPATKVKYAKLIEEGQWPGDEKPCYMTKSDSCSSLDSANSEAEEDQRGRSRYPS